MSAIFYNITSKGNIVCTLGEKKRSSSTAYLWHSRRLVSNEPFSALGPWHIKREVEVVSLCINTPIIYNGSLYYKRAGTCLPHVVIK